jgi:hypothetical protein
VAEQKACNSLTAAGKVEAYVRNGLKVACAVPPGGVSDRVLALVDRAVADAGAIRRTLLNPPDV